MAPISPRLLRPDAVTGMPVSLGGQYVTMLIEAPTTALSYGRAAIVFDELRRTLEASPQFCTVRVIRVTDGDGGAAL